MKPYLIVGIPGQRRRGSLLQPAIIGIKKIGNWYPSHGDKIEAYYYGEDMPEFDTIDLYLTVFNIYTYPHGEIYACYWAKFPSEYRLEHGTSDGIRP